MSQGMEYKYRRQAQLFPDPLVNMVERCAQILEDQFESEVR